MSEHNKPNRSGPRRSGKARDILNVAQAVVAATATAYELIAPQVRKWRQKRRAKKAATEEIKNKQ